MVEKEDEGGRNWVFGREVEDFDRRERRNIGLVRKISPHAFSSAFCKIIVPAMRFSHNVHS